MARKYLSVSRSVALSLAALLVLTGAMFMVTTFQQDSEEWVLVEDQVFDDNGLYSSTPLTVGDDSQYVFSFDEETSVYSFVVTGGDKVSSTKHNLYSLICMEGFDFSKNYKIEMISSDVPFTGLNYYSGTQNKEIFNLRSVSSSDDGSYSASIILLDQLVTDLSYQDSFGINCQTESAAATFAENTFSFQVYELQTDNTGSIAAGITGLVLIVMGVFAMPMHNILRRK